MTKKSLLIISILLIGFISIFIGLINSIKQSNNVLEENYFNDFKLKAEGIICRIEKGEGSLKYFVTVRVNNSNLNSYKTKSPLGVYFVLLERNTLVFVDHYNNYKIGDKICIGCEENIILLKSPESKIKFIKKREEAMLFDVSQPNKKMLELLKLGCK